MVIKYSLNLYVFICFFLMFDPSIEWTRETNFLIHANLFLFFINEKVDGRVYKFIYLLVWDNLLIPDIDFLKLFVLKEKTLFD